LRLDIDEKKPFNTVAIMKELSLYTILTEIILNGTEWHFR
jgi:hypothetical protein